MERHSHIHNALNPDSGKNTCVTGDVEVPVVSASFTLVFIHNININLDTLCSYSSRPSVKSRIIFCIVDGNKF